MTPNGVVQTKDSEKSESDRRQQPRDLGHQGRAADSQHHLPPREQIESWRTGRGPGPRAVALQLRRPSESAWSLRTAETPGSHLQRLPFGRTELGSRHLRF